MAETWSRKQEKTCVACGKQFNSWGMARTKCLQCDAIPPRIAKIYKQQIDRDDPLVRL